MQPRSGSTTGTISPVRPLPTNLGGAAMELVDLASTAEGKHDFVGYLTKICEHMAIDYAA